MFRVESSPRLSHLFTSYHLILLISSLPLTSLLITSLLITSPLISLLIASLLISLSSTLFSFFQHNFCVKPYVPREPRRDPSNRIGSMNMGYIYIRHCQKSNSRPVPSQAGADTTRPQWRTLITSLIKTSLIYLFIYFTSSNMQIQFWIISSLLIASLLIIWFSSTHFSSLHFSSPHLYSLIITSPLITSPLIISLTSPHFSSPQFSSLHLTIVISLTFTLWQLKFRFLIFKTIFFIVR